MEEEKEQKYHCKCNSIGGGFFGLGFLGALIYYIQHADTFWAGVLGILKSFVWPVILIYKIMEFLKF